MNKIALRIPVTTYKEVTISVGMRTALKALLFPTYQATPVQKVPAIKALREELGCGLKEAKDLVDAMTPQMLDEAKASANPYARLPDRGFVDTLGDILARNQQR